MALPSDEYLLAHLREAMRLYQEALPTATDMQKVVWHHCSRAKFVEAAFPFYEGDAEVSCVINVAMLNVIETMPLEDALASAKARIAKNWQPPSKRYQRFVYQRYLDSLKQR
ncbi:hypothetical protein CQ12_21460 [Bradyrhizobium jicamae]|uniref:Uncharacterized protein n=1 Tax=Bradyrhizobium jicamae TaxID=280332 RepID=A0A0R3M1B4_9BRAD|nr:hypothetical protein [Bradyrhizobium jicamae]KRR10838.1 hypothetical protein CQ12_21460 [Bradyrhizobium jicamae]